MATRLLSIGYVQSVAQNEVLALPARRCLFFTDAAAPTVQMANDTAFGTPIAVTLVNGSAEVAGGFLRITSAGPVNVNLKAMS